MFATIERMEIAYQPGQNTEALKATLHQDIHTRARELFKERLEGERINDLVDGAYQLRRYTMSRPDLYSASRAILLAALTTAWTASECLAADAWENVLNENPSFRVSALRAEGELDGALEGLDRKSISVGPVAKYGFDLRKSMGSLLRRKFDFTSVRGIAKAYDAAFGESARGDTGAPAR
jgi:hypothetical protein